MMCWGGAREEEKRRAQLLGKPPSEVERDAAEVGVAEEFVEMVGEELKDETEVVLEWSGGFRVVALHHL